MNRKLTADILYPVAADPIPNGVIETDSEGRIRQIGHRDQYPAEELEIFEGAMVPGFVNSHCHLELSFMKNQIAEHTGLIDFVKKVVAIRDDFSDAVQQDAIHAAHNEMWRNGIMAVGDISNDTRSFEVKKNGAIRYHTFVEVFDLGPAMTDSAMETGRSVYNAAPKNNGHSASITPHAPYSVTKNLAAWADDFTARDGRLLSIHMQEQAEENLLFTKKEGAWLGLFRDFGIDDSWLKKTGKNSLESFVQYLTQGNRLLLVHNTHTSAADIEWAHVFNPDVWWCFCPNANLYIENTLPNYQLFLNAGARCTLGTDSLASNWQLSLLEEMKVIAANASYISFEKLLEWGTLNGALLLGMDKELGSFEVGKQPGILHLREGGILTPSSTVERIL